MINIRSIRKLSNNDGITLKHGKKVCYKTGWQVATEGVEATTARGAINAVKVYGGDCGVWYSDGVYYIDRCHREATKARALEVGRACNQQSIFGWRRQNLVWCN